MTALGAKCLAPSAQVRAFLPTSREGGGAFQLMDEALWRDEFGDSIRLKVPKIFGKSN